MNDIEETVRRLRKHPIFTMDKQNVTSDAADIIENLKQKLTAYKEVVDVAAHMIDMYGTNKCNSVYVVDAAHKLDDALSKLKEMKNENCNGKHY